MNSFDRTLVSALMLLVVLLLGVVVVIAGTGGGTDPSTLTFIAVIGFLLHLRVRREEYGHFAPWVHTLGFVFVSVTAVLSFGAEMRQALWPQLGSTHNSAVDVIRTVISANNLFWVVMLMLRPAGSMTLDRQPAP